MKTTIIPPFPDKLTPADAEAVDRILRPLEFADDLAALLIKYQLEDHPACAAVYEAAKRFVGEQVTTLPAKKKSVAAIKRAAIKAHRTAYQTA